MLEVLARAGAQQKVHLIYGVTRDLDLVLVDAIEAYAAKLPNFSFATVVADAASSHPRKGWVTQHIPAEALNDGDVDVYLCGPPPMVDAVRQYFDDEGVKPNSFHYEKFTPTSRQRRRDHATILWQGHRRHGRSARHRPWRRAARRPKAAGCCSSIARISSPTSRPKRPVARRPASSPISKPTKVRMRRSHMPRRRSAASTS